MSRIQISRQHNREVLSPAQRRFNQLTKQIAQLREQLTKWTDAVPAFHQSWHQAITPLRKQFLANSREWVLALDAALDKNQWTRTERQLLTQMLCEETRLLLGAGDDDELKALFNKHSDIDFDIEKQEELAEFRTLTETMTGIDFGDEEFSSEEELLQRMHERAAEKSTDDPFGEQQRNQRKKSAKQLAADQKREAEAAMTKQSVRDVYRKLASALHPDKESDPAQREVKTALMARVNKAYADNDLLGLLEAQLEIEHIDARSIATITAERLRHYNKVLADQVEQLRFEMEEIESRFRIEFSVPYHHQVNPMQFGRVLTNQLAALRQELAQQTTKLKTLANKDSAKRWLRTQTRQRRAEIDMMEDDFDDLF